ncbi:hypothetical protein CICLE_v10026888mg [Citrus x clementina]|uniref:Uncharacterized protein n=1 Tax=Citrus clementina TaxID=85681 RepID=V4RZD6_CITCL|nr:hypothetical protein CICLE_v10026888mg [Citrus x clementina]
MPTVQGMGLKDVTLQVSSDKEAKDVHLCGMNLMRDQVFTSFPCFIFLHCVFQLSGFANTIFFCTHFILAVLEK